MRETGEGGKTGVKWHGRKTGRVRYWICRLLHASSILPISVLCRFRNTILPATRCIVADAAHSSLGEPPVHRLIVRDFGPIQQATVDVARFLLFIGPQASGKSTLSKLIYYFLHVRDEVIRFIYEAADGPETHQLSHMLKKRLRNRFVEFFGPAPQPTNVAIEYRYTEDCQLKVALDQRTTNMLMLTSPTALGDRSLIW